MCGVNTVLAKLGPVVVVVVDVVLEVVLDVLVVCEVDVVLDDDDVLVAVDVPVVVEEVLLVDVLLGAVVVVVLLSVVGELQEHNPSPAAMAVAAMETTSRGRSRMELISAISAWSRILSPGVDGVKELPRLTHEANAVVNGLL